ncbi:MAG: energy transducer TonB [Chitinophagales bacterium]|nr:energy transducer TonB [Chitinophagales bacterium]
MANGISGTVDAKFVVNTDGSISDVTIVGNRIPHGEDLENECIRLIKSFPKWKPGKKRGKVVKVYYTQRITFS